MNKYIIAAALVAVLIMYEMNQSESDDPQEENYLDMALTKIDEVIESDELLADMRTSEGMINMLKRREGLKLTRYRLNDGGYTIGYGHYEKLIDKVPASITMQQALEMFYQDVAQRGEKWVKLYIKVSLYQYQFDALVSIAFNMSPQSFKKFAESVNNGNGINDMAMRSVAWVAPEYTRGIQNRRNEEMNLFNNGVYV